MYNYNCDYFSNLQLGMLFDLVVVFDRNWIYNFWYGIARLEAGLNPEVPASSQFFSACPLHSLVLAQMLSFYTSFFLH
jgi:hypothetical protein